MLLLNMIKKQMTKDKEETDLHSYWMAFKNFKKEKKETHSMPLLDVQPHPKYCYLESTSQKCYSKKVFV